ncbi:helix-turn-helix domain-containing protein [Rhodococcus sp. 077-4]|uniref:helix-turn-helix domain-containing protein n=1 Tax=Rhodococcus sp. 077-4 TaxID=2789271 RepID=UPI0039F49715
MSARALPETCCPSATLWLWAGHAVYLGPSLQLDYHSGSVLCFAGGVDAPFTLRDNASGQWCVRSAAVAPRTVHRIESHGERMLFAYFDPGASRAQAVFDRMITRHGEIGLTLDAESELLELAASPAPDPIAISECIRGPEIHEIDERILDAMEMVRGKPGAVGSAADLAAAVNLSTSRFLHLFAAEAGTSFRRYRLWARMLHVGAAVAAGDDLTRASVEAGFASPSHFSTAFNAMFGLSAVALLGGGAQVIVMES